MATKKRRNKWKWLFLVPVVILITLGILVWPKLKPELELGGCGNGPVFTTAPTAPTDFSYLVPLGNLGPPDHTVPTDHIYYVFAKHGPTAPAIAVRAPGKIRITQANRQTVYINGKIRTDDYHLFFSPCRGVSANFDHINKLGPKLAAVIGNQKGSCKDTHPRPGDTYRYCNSDTDVLLQPGEIVGTAGQGAAYGFDFGVADKRQPALVYANPKRYGKADHTVCPISLFSEPVKTELMSRFKRTVAPVCGEVDQDKPGTLQGNWYSFKGSASGVESWSKSLALVHQNTDPTIGAISMGSLGGYTGILNFTPRSSGTLSREFSTVTPGPTIYCYAQNGPNNYIGPQPVRGNNRVLIQMTSTTELKIERQTGICGGTLAFAHPTTYYR